MRQARGVQSLGEQGEVKKVIRKGFAAGVTFAERPQECAE